MNPRVSRSSALASKATGFPIAKIAAKLAVGYTLDELDNDITGSPRLSFEPTIDYVVTKIPRFAVREIPRRRTLLTTAMKSVGEAMAIGRTFQKACKRRWPSWRPGLTGFDEIEIAGAERPGGRVRSGSHAISEPSGAGPAFACIAQAMRYGMSRRRDHRRDAFDPWFLARLREIDRHEEQRRADGLPTDRADAALKMMGFTDARLGACQVATKKWRQRARRIWASQPSFKRIDTCAAEFERRHHICIRPTKPRDGRS